MLLFNIVEFDNDYKTKTGEEFMRFQSLNHAKIWCKDNTWSGYTYIVDESIKPRKEN